MVKIRIHKDWKIPVPENQNIRAMLSRPPAYYQSRLKKIGFTGPKTKLLDAGCGSGIWSIAASYLNAHVDAIDSTQEYLNVACEINGHYRRRNIQFRSGKMESLPYGDESFDYVISYCAWMYTRRPQSLKEMARVLKPGGRIYLGAVAGLGWYLNLLGEAIKTGNRNLFTQSLRAMRTKIQTSEKETRRLFAQNNLKIIGLGPDVSLGQKINIKPIYNAKKSKILGFWNVYEVLAEKSKIQNECLKTNYK